MTREEAIARFKGIKDSMSISIAQSKFYKSKAELNELCDMAISALTEAEKRRQYGQNYETDDCVQLGVTDKNKDKVILYDAFGEREYYPQTEPSDLISRAEAHKAICRLCSDYERCEYNIGKTCYRAREHNAIDRVPSVSAERVVIGIDQPLHDDIGVLVKGTQENDCLYLDELHQLVKIVRCKDCYHYDKGENESDSWQYCRFMRSDVHDDGFCSWAVAKMKGGAE